MSHIYSTLKVRVIAALMVLVSVSSVPSTLANQAAEPFSTTGSSDVHDAFYVNSIKNKATAEFIHDAAAMSPTIEVGGSTEALETADFTSGDFTTDGDSASSEGSAAKTSGAELPALPGDLDVLGRPVASLPLLPMTPLNESSDVIVVDNDQFKDRGAGKTSNEKSSWTTVRSENGKTVIHAGARFPVVLVSSHTSKNCLIGDRVLARLKTDIFIGDRLIAQKGDEVLGHVTSAYKARRMLVAQIVLKRWLRANGAIGIKFDEIITSSGEHIQLTAAPARMARIIENKNEGRVLGINHKGEIVAPLSTQLKNQGVQLAIRAGASAGGVFSLGAVPIAFGLIGAAHPEFAFLHPVGRNVRHRRLKGFGMGVLTGLPGGFLVADYIIRGVESILKPGDEFMCEFQQDFNGDLSTTAQLEPQEQIKVHGEVVKPKNSK